MDALIYLKALVLGLLEGLTEFLPISSTGHLIIAADLLGFTGEKAKTFEIVIQLGAILAICWHYRAKISEVVRGLPSDAWARNFALNIILAFIPAALLGLAFHGIIKEHLFNPFNVAIALIIGGIVILLIERQTYAPRIHSVDDMRWTDALKIGCCQAFSLIPGTSRSGATIMGGLFFGLSRQAATEFSFFLAIPTMFAATFYDLYKNWNLLQAPDTGLFAVGFLAAFTSAFFAVKFLLHYIANHTFKAFAYYRIIFGMIVLIYFW
ncbi:MAG: undecaprenyl-diphosphate phosphatase [Gammaproteobacteria bacterium]